MADVLLKDGVTTTDDRRLDRIKQFDDKSRLFTIREHLESGAVAQKRKRASKPGPTLDQGKEGACTGFAGAHAMEARPFGVKGIDNAWARELYFDNQRNDDWPGGEYPGAAPQYSGSSVLGAMKSLTVRGLIKSYRWVGAGSQTPIDDVIDSLKYVGPVDFGINWYESMFDPQPNGLMTVTITDQPAGGHSLTAQDMVNIKLEGTSKRKLYIVFQNSWGTSWGTQFKGQGGFFYMQPEDLEVLLSKGGEGAVPLKTA